MFDVIAKIWFVLGSLLDSITNVTTALEKTTSVLDEKAEAFKLKSQELNKQELADLRALAKNKPVSTPETQAKSKPKRTGTKQQEEFEL